MIVTRYLDVRMAEQWEIDPADLPEWDGEEDSLAEHDWEILKVGDFLSAETYPTDDDSNLDYTIESGWDPPGSMDMWIDPDVMVA